MHQPLRLRQYSIASSPRAQAANELTLVYSMLGHEMGAATSYMKSLDVGDTLQVAVRKTTTTFHLPEDDARPIVMAAIGSGVAPFRAFLQDRAASLAAGQKLGEALLFVGCRRPDHDRLFGEEFDELQRKGVVTIFYSYSQAANESEGCAYIQDRIWQQRERVASLFGEHEALGYVCGSGAAARTVDDVAAKIMREYCGQRGKEMTDDEARERWVKWRGKRYAVDVFD